MVQRKLTKIHSWAGQIRIQQPCLSHTKRSGKHVCSNLLLCCLPASCQVFRVCFSVYHLSWANCSEGWESRADAGGKCAPLLSPRFCCSGVRRQNTHSKYYGTLQCCTGNSLFLSWITICTCVLLSKQWHNCLKKVLVAFVTLLWIIVHLHCEEPSNMFWSIWQNMFR